MTFPINIHLLSCQFMVKGPETGDWQYVGSKTTNTLEKFSTNENYTRAENTNLKSDSIALRQMRKPDSLVRTGNKTWGKTEEKAQEWRTKTTIRSCKLWTKIRFFKTSSHVTIKLALWNYRRSSPVDWDQRYFREGPSLETGLFQNSSCKTFILFSTLNFFIWEHPQNIFLETAIERTQWHNLSLKKQQL